MTLAHRRGASRELEAAKLLGGRRQLRLRFESRPDLDPIELPSGFVLQPEVKTRRRLPRLITRALEQARRYEPAAVPLAIVSEYGGEAIACLPLRAFAAIVGLDPAQVLHG